MSSFTSELIVSPISGRKWKLKRSFKYRVGSQYSKDVISVPAGFVTDFASTDILQWVAVILTVIYAGLSWFFPIPVWLGTVFLIIILAGLLITPYGKPGKAAVLHDYLYHTKQVSRAMADLILFEAMLVNKTKPWKAWLIYEGVKLGGWLAWKS